MTDESSGKGWLAHLVDGVLQGYDPSAALLRLPSELRGVDRDAPDMEARVSTLLVRSLHQRLPGAKAEASEAEEFGRNEFIAAIQGHMTLLLDVWLVQHVTLDVATRRALMATLLAAFSGDPKLAVTVDPGRSPTVNQAPLDKVFKRVGARLRERGAPAGDPRLGLPMRAGVLSIERRLLVHLAVLHHQRGWLDPVAARALLDQATDDKVLLVEALAAISAASGSLDAPTRRIAIEQVARLGLPAEAARRARGAIREPPGAALLAQSAPPETRVFLLQQLFISALAAGLPSAPRGRFIETFAAEAGLSDDTIHALEADAAELYAAQARWLEPGPDIAADLWPVLASGIHTEAADEIMDKLATVVSENLEAIVTEVKQTGELGQLLAKAATKTLSAEEKRKVKSQLVDLAKTVPALAIFAAPGGMLLLPLLAKLLPFNMLPSAWDKRKGGATRQGTHAKKR